MVIRGLPPRLSHPLITKNKKDAEASFLMANLCSNLLAMLRQINEELDYFFAAASATLAAFSIEISSTSNTSVELAGIVPVSRSA